MKDSKTPALKIVKAEDTSCRSEIGDTGYEVCDRDYEILKK